MSDLVKRLRAFVAIDGGDIADVEKAADRIEQLEELKVVVENLLKVKGHYHTEQAYKQLEEAFKKVS